MHWIKTLRHQLKTFVRNRVVKIQNVNQEVDWRHVRIDDNPADAISRGKMPSELIKNQLYFHSPAWLTNSIHTWPESILEPIIIPEMQVQVISNTTVTNPIIDFSRFSNFKRLKRSLAHVHRFVELIVRKNKVVGNLTPEEINFAFLQIIKQIQAHSFSKEIAILTSGKPYSGNLSPLAPFIEPDGILRVGGYLKLSDLPYAERHQILLPQKHYVTQLIIRNYHLDSEYLEIQGHPSRAKPSFPQYVMENLLKSRVIFTRPFLQSGVNFCGPFYIKVKRFRNRKLEKIYVAVFVCMSVKAVHLELVQDLTSEACFAAIRRFFAQRGCSIDLHTDNATNFSGEKNEINEIQNFFNSENHMSEIKQS